ncbi:helix-turn-helix domain-containing protein [Saccharopolyspora sp. NPDC002376]
MPLVRGNAIRRAYEAMGLTRREFANKAGIVPRTLTNITSNGAPCSFPAAVRIATALGWDVRDVLAESMGKSPEQAAS